MPHNPVILALDTSAAHCAVALLWGDQLLEARREEMAKGQAERLLPLCEALLAAHDTSWRDLAAVAVCTGPGNFTGIRIAVSAARGLGLAMDIPSIGVTMFEAMAVGNTGQAALEIPARKGFIYRQQIVDDAMEGTADMIAETRQLERPYILADGQSLPEVVARIAATRLDQSNSPATPYYIQPPDAAPSKTAPVKILS